MLPTLSSNVYLTLIKCCCHMLSLAAVTCMLQRQAGLCFIKRAPADGLTPEHLVIFQQ